MNSRALFYISLAVVALIGAMLACSAGDDNMVIGDSPQYVCPSATPRATDTALPTRPPTYPIYLDANLASPYFHNDNRIHLQIAAQNAGRVDVKYWGTRLTTPYTWPGSNGQWVTIGVSPPTATTFNWTLIVPGDVNSVTLVVRGEHSAATITLTSYRNTLVYPTSQPYPCCGPPPIYPTTAPTYTPYPTATPYLLENDYFLGDMVYTTQQDSGLRLGFRLLSVQVIDATEPDADGEPQSIYIWSMYITNIGTIPYTIFPPAQMYISVVREGPPPAAEWHGVWGPSLSAAAEAGVPTDLWDMQDLDPDQSRTFTLAAYGPRAHAWKLSYVLDPSHRDPDIDDPTEVPGTNIVSWINTINTICTGDIQEP